MSSESFKFDYETREQKQFTDQLQAQLSQKCLINQFIGSLEQLTSPELLYQDLSREILANVKNRGALYRIFRDMYMQLIEPNTDTTEWGNIRKKFSEEIRPCFISEFGESGERITALSEDEIKQKLKLLTKAVAEFTKTKREGNLGEYSPWLRRFKRNLAKDLEIPGQYSGKSKPMPEYHVKIESFDERVSE